MASVENVEVERTRPVIIERRPRRDRTKARSFGRIGTALLAVGAAALLGRASANRPLRKRSGAGALAARVTGNIGRGLAAGAFGTLAISTVMTLDSLATEAYRARKKHEKAASLRQVLDQSASSAADLASNALGFTPKDSAHAKRLGNMAHWAYGTTWGLALPLLRAAGLGSLSSTAAVCTGQLTVEMLAMPSLKLLPPPTKWGVKGIVSTVYQHAIYAIATVKAYDWLKSHSAE